MPRKSPNFFNKGLDKATEEGIHSEDKKIRHAAMTAGCCGVTTLLCASTIIGLPIAFFTGAATFIAGNRFIKLSEQADRSARAEVVEPVRVHSQEMAGPRSIS